MRKIKRFFRRSFRLDIWSQRPFIAVRRLQMFAGSELYHGREFMRQARETFWTPILW